VRPDLKVEIRLDVLEEEDSSRTRRPRGCLIANGASPSSQEFVLPQGTTSSRKPFWRVMAGGFRYSDLLGEQGPVTAVRIRRTSGGRFDIESVVLGQNGPVEVVPPNPGTDAFMTLKLGLAPEAGDRYCVQYGPESDITNDGPFFFSATNPVEKGCPPPPTTTTTTTTTPGGIQCCLRTVTCGPFDNCQIMSAGECTSAGGLNLGPGTCTAPCPTTTNPPSACCTQSTPGGPSDQCTIQSLCQCLLLGGSFRSFQSCTPNPCATTTTTSSSTTSSIAPTTTTSTSSTTTSTTSPAPVCGNGIVEPGEACDGGPFCAPDCFADVPNCCSGAGQCIDAPGFSLFNNLFFYCTAVLPGSAPAPGDICRPDGSCSPEPIEPPISVCCQGSGSCYDATVSSTAALWSFHNGCQGSMMGLTSPAATCGPVGNCIPE
jgi:hypothetical protein